MNIGYRDLCSEDFSFTNIESYRMEKDGDIEYNYESKGRTKHLVFCQFKGKRCYYHNDTHICTLYPGDTVFLPEGAKYRSFAPEKNDETDGIGVSFNILTPENESIFINECPMYFSSADYPEIKKHFKKILYSVVNPTGHRMRLKGEMYTLLDTLLSEKTYRDDFDNCFKDIMEAIRLLEKHPENNLTVKELGALCHMSESSFLRKFKAYSGGIAPIRYRNNIRFMIAQELSASHLTMNEIAEKLGFFDGAHLCKMYKKEKGHSLKRKL